MADAKQHYQELLLTLDRVHKDIYDKELGRAISGIDQARILTRGLFRFIRQPGG
jgi:hypothetical protein